MVVHPVSLCSMCYGSVSNNIVKYVMLCIRQCHCVVCDMVLYPIMSLCYGCAPVPCISHLNFSCMRYLCFALSFSLCVCVRVCVCMRQTSAGGSRLG